MNGVMLDGAYRLTLPDGERHVIVRNNRVVEAHPDLEHALGRSPDDVRRWAEAQGGSMVPIASRPSNPSADA
jgi:hypothetical protein